jgi:hypothetical protein
MRPHALVSPALAEVTHACAACTKHVSAIDGLTQALGNLRRGATALSAENSELRAELASLYKQRSAANG